MGNEPTAVLSVLGAVTVLIVFYGLMTQDEVQLWQGLIVALIPILQGLWTRSKVMSVDTIQQAGLTPRMIHAMADDPTVEPVS